MRASHGAWRCLAGLLVAGALSACGGGGGGSAPPPPAPSGTGIVPTPGALGATIYADATTLRPLRAGATWTYRGHDLAYPGAIPTVYSDVVTQTSAASGVNESGTNPFNEGPDSAGIASANGIVSSTTTVDLTDTGAGSALTFPELRSPVRQNDQVTVLDQHIDDVGVDIDGDGKNDGADIAVYRVVVGSDDVTPENLPRLAAVRVDMIALVRFKQSSNGQNTPVIEATRLSTWYSPGIGIVRQRIETPSTTSGLRVADETITTWDGLTEGLGYAAPQRAVVPAGAPAYAGMTLSDRRAAVAFDDHAVMLTGAPDGDPNAAVLSVLDLRGNVTAVHGFARPVNFESPASLFRAGSGAVSVLQSQLATSSFALVRFDADGNVIGSPQGTAVDLASGISGDYVVDSWFTTDGSDVWVAWIRRYITPAAAPAEQLLVRKFDLSGNALTPVLTVIDWGSLSSNVVPKLTANSQQLVIEWHGGTASTPVDAVTYAVVAAPFSQVLLKSLSPTLQWSSIQPVSWSNGLAFVLSDAAFASYAVRLDAAYDPVWSAGNNPLNELMSQAWGGTGLARPSVVALGNSLVLAAPVRDVFWQDDSLMDTVNVVADYTLNNGTLASSAPGRITRFPSALQPDAGGPYFGAADSVLVFPDRVLVFSDPFFAVTTTVVWRR